MNEFEKDYTQLLTSMLEDEAAMRGWEVPLSDNEFEEIWEVCIKKLGL